jgi:hypothetical protein
MKLADADALPQRHQRRGPQVLRDSSASRVLSAKALEAICKIGQRLLARTRSVLTV